MPVVVSSDPAEVSQAREAGRDLSVDELVAVLGGGGVQDEPFHRAVRSRATDLRPLLQELVSDRSKPQPSRLSALSLLEVAPSWSVLLSMLGEFDAAGFGQVLRWLTQHRVPEPPEELLGYADHPEERLQRQSWEMLAFQQVPGWVKTLEDRFETSSERGRQVLCRLLAEAGSEQALSYLAGLESLSNAHLRALDQLCAHVSSAPLALELVRKVCREQESACRLLAAYGDRCDVAVLRSARAALDPHSSRLVEEGLLRILGEEAVEDVVEGLQCPRRLNPLVGALRSSGLVDPRLGEALLKIDDTLLNFQSAYDVCVVLLNHQQEPPAAMWQKTLKGERYKLERYRAGFEPGQAFAQLVELGVIPAGELPEVPDDPDQWVLIRALETSGHLYWDDSEAGCPPFYPRMLDSLARISRGFLNPEHVSQSVVGGRVVLQFLQREKLFRVELELQEDWADTSGLLEVANRALLEAGAEVRFFSLATGDQNFAFLCSPPAAFQKAVEHGLLF